VPIKEKMTKNPPRKNDDSRTKELESCKKNEQRGKTRTSSLPLPEALGIWPYVK
jgi:hypothetical protein